MTMQHLKRHFDFVEMKEAPFKSFSSRFVLQMRENNLNQIRIGITVSKKISKLATQRNRLRRQMRNIMRLDPEIEKLYPSHDIVLIARKEALNTPYTILVQDFNYLLHHLHRKEQNEN